MKQHHDKQGPVRARVFAACCSLAMRWRWVTIVATVAALRRLASSAWRFVQQQFFPSSDRPELIVDWNAAAEHLDRRDQGADGRSSSRRRSPATRDVEHWSSYVGQGAVRFVLSFDVQPANPYFGQTIIVTKGLEARDTRARRRCRSICSETSSAPTPIVKLLDIGPPVGRPVQYRVSGPDIQKVRELAQELGGVVGAQSRCSATSPTTGTSRRASSRSTCCRTRRASSASRPQDIATALNGIVGGIDGHAGARRHLSGQCRRPRRGDAERGSIETLQNLQLPGQQRPVRAARRGRELPLRDGAAGGLAARPACRPSPSRPASSTRRSRRRSSTQLEPTCASIRRNAAGRLRRRSRRHGRGKRQGAGADRRRRAADAVRHGDDPDDPAAELPAAVPGGRGGAARR